MRSTLTTTAVVAIVVVGLTLTAAVGPALAGHDADDTDVIIHANETASDDLAEFYVDVTGEESIGTTDNTTTVTVVIDGVNGSNTTELHNETLTITEGNVSSSSYAVTDNDTTDYEEFTLTVEAANNTGEYINESETEWGSLVENTGGGGGFLSGDGALGGGLGALAIIIGGYVLLREE